MFEAYNQPGSIFAVRVLKGDALDDLVKQSELLGLSEVTPNFKIQVQ